MLHPYSIFFSCTVVSADLTDTRTVYNVSRRQLWKLAFALHPFRPSGEPKKERRAWLRREIRFVLFEPQACLHQGETDVRENATDPLPRLWSIRVSGSLTPSNKPRGTVTYNVQAHALILAEPKTWGKFRDGSTIRVYTDEERLVVQTKNHTGWSRMKQQNQHIAVFMGV